MHTENNLFLLTHDDFSECADKLRIIVGEYFAKKDAGEGEKFNELSNVLTALIFSFIESYYGSIKDKEDLHCVLKILDRYNKDQFEKFRYLIERFKHKSLEKLKDKDNL